MRPALWILHTNDLHGRLTDEQAAWLAALRHRLQPALLLDSGDAVDSWNLVPWPSPQPMLRRLNAAGYDAAAPGNREFGATPWLLRRKLPAAAFPVLCANLVARDGGPGPLPAAVTFQPTAGPPVRVIGVTKRMIGTDPLSSALCRWRFEDPIDAVRRQLEPGAVHLVLSHLGNRRGSDLTAADRVDDDLAAALPELTAILGGHSHTPGIHRVGGVLVTQNPPHADGLTLVGIDADGRPREPETRRFGEALDRIGA